LLPLKDEDRVRILSAVARKGPRYQVLRVVVITLSLLILLAVPLTGLAQVDLWGGNHTLLFEKVDFFTALKGVIVAIGILWGITFTTNVIVGRFFCGWGCPVGYVSRLGEDVQLAKKNRVTWFFQHAAGAGFVATFIASIMIWWVDPMVMVDGSNTARLTTLGIFLFLSFGGLGHAFMWRFGFCLNVCPIGLYYRYVTSQAPIGIVFSEEPSPCIECGVCEKVCPVILDPKRLGEELPAISGDPEDATRYGDAECIRCGDCIEGCGMVYEAREGETAPLRWGFVKDRTEPPEPKEKKTAPATAGGPSAPSAPTAPSAPRAPTAPSKPK
jgi:ferredoxin-type protein NapH